MRAEAVDGRLRVGVSDTGVGIPGDELGKIFDEFHRADSASARRRRGTGLGLTISRRLARTLGGDVTVESRLGRRIDVHARPAPDYADGIEAAIRRAHVRGRC